MKKISLSNSTRKLLVDDEDYDRCSLWTWNLDNGDNVHACIGSITTSFAKYVMQSDEMFDHKDQNKLNGQKSNLRLATYSQNGANRNKWAKSPTSEYKGVCFKNGCWYSTIKVNYKQIHLGCFSDEILAAKAYNKAAKKHFGEFAVLNQFQMGVTVSGS